MAMETGIFRAGPFASAAVSFLAEPGSPVVTTLPVNAADGTDPGAWSTKHFFKLSGTLNDSTSYSSGLPGISYDNDGSDTSANRTVTFSAAFMYQAESDFNLGVDYQIYVDVLGAGGTATATADMTAGTYSDSGSHFPPAGQDANISMLTPVGGVTETLTAASVPTAFSISADVTITGPTTGSVEIYITLTT